MTVIAFPGHAGRSWPRLDLTASVLLAFAITVIPALALSPAPVRAPIAVVLIGLAPGLSIVRRIIPGRSMLAMLASIAASLAITTLVSLGLLYLRMWSWPACAGVLVLVIHGAVLAPSWPTASPETRATPTIGGRATPNGEVAHAGLPVNLNRAAAAELERLRGVGPATAAAIVEFRTQNGRFGSVEQLLRVRGIGPVKFDANRKLVTT